ncbi:MAG: DNA alkylation repair protein [Thalassospira sp.]|jgi:hypothetical protein|nr:DNA alkylation repair protein [Thalassospira sp.]
MTGIIKPAKGARRIADIPPDWLAALNSGAAESRTLVEGLAVNFGVLLRACCPMLPENTRHAIAVEPKITRRMALLGKAIAAHAAPEAFAAHPSDTLRGGAAYAIAALPLTLAEKLDRLRPLADDPHFGVREWAWLALRPALMAETDAALQLLTPWAEDAAPNIRRFASEATRPRGVWCAHWAELKKEPWRAESLLKPLLRGETHPYVNASVRNWLNDAAKSQPEWVAGLRRSALTT